MNSKQRVLSTINGRIPDRVPFGEFAIDFDTVEKIIGHETFLRAKAKSQIAFWEGRHEEVVDSYINDRIELMKKVDLDIITFTDATWRIPLPTGEPPPRKIAENTWEDQLGPDLQIFRHHRRYRLRPRSGPGQTRLYRRAIRNKSRTRPGSIRGRSRSSIP